MGVPDTSPDTSIDRRRVGKRGRRRTRAGEVVRLAGAVAALLLFAAPAPAAAPAPDPVPDPARARTGGYDFAALYPADLEYEKEDPRPLDWTCGPEDVWSLRSFEVDTGKAFRLKLGRSTAIFGHHGTNVLWAVVIPDRPAKIRTTLSGDRESVEHVWLRFHPGKIGELFPSRTISGQGEKEMLPWAFRVYTHKIERQYALWNYPIVPPDDVLLVDVDTKEETRRVYSIDLDSDEVHYKSSFLTHRVPDPKPTGKRESVSALDAAWELVKDEYAALSLKPDLDWFSLREEYVKRAARCKSTFETATVIHDLLGNLDDSEIWVMAGEDLLPGYGRWWVDEPQSWEGIRSLLGDYTHAGSGIWWSRTQHNVGYVNLTRFDRPETVRDFDLTLTNLAETWCLVIDLRFTGLAADQEDVVGQLAGRFVSEPKLYAYSQTREGPIPGNLSEKQELTLEPRGPWTYTAPVYLILGPATAGPAERFVLMLQQAESTRTFGAPTAGASLRSEWVELPEDIRVWLPKGLDLTPEGQPLHGTGIEPDIPLEIATSDYKEDTDPVIFEVLEEVLKTPYSKRTPGRKITSEGD